MRVMTRAKVNLLLRVFPRRADGFHPIETIFHPVDVVDDLRVEAWNTSTTEINMTSARGDVVNLPDAANNLITAAVRLMRAESGRDDGIAISVAKHVPIAAGLAGGSANAAGTLIALDRLWDLRSGDETLDRLAGKLGSDVPYCLRGGTILATGRGEIMQALPDLDAWFVLGISERGLSTAEVYGGWDSAGTGHGPGSAEMIAAISAGDVSRVGSLLHNDLEPVTFSLRPELAAGKDAMVAAGAPGALVSGSGPTVFALCENRSQAGEIAAAVADRFDRVDVVRSATSIVSVADDSVDSTG